jgi:hypothetical protein
MGGKYWAPPGTARRLLDLVARGEQRRQEMLHAQAIAARLGVERCDRLIQPPQLSVVLHDQFPHGSWLRVCWPSIYRRVQSERLTVSAHF